MVTRGANNGRRVVLTPISKAAVDQPAQRKRKDNVSGPMNIDHGGGLFNT